MIFSTFSDAFLNTRARLQRLSDARFFSGWVSGSLGNHLSLRLAPGGDLALKDRIFVSLAAADFGATFHAEVTGLAGCEATLLIEGTPKYGPATEDVRYSTEAMSGTLLTGARKVDLEIGDISSKGLGGHVGSELARGTSVRFAIDGLYGQVAGAAEVRYCRADHTQPGRFRIGLLITEVGRIDQARWTRMLGSQAA